MITIEYEQSTDAALLIAAVFGEFTIADYEEFEAEVLRALESTHTRVDLLLDLRDMTSFTVDVAWEELKFARRHPRDFRRIAVVTTSMWISWSAWISRLFVDAAFHVFDNFDAARGWVGSGNAQPLPGAL